MSNKPRFGKERVVQLVEQGKAKRVYFVLKQSSLWKTVHWTVFVAAELRAEHTPLPERSYFCFRVKLSLVGGVHE